MGHKGRKEGEKDGALISSFYKAEIRRYSEKLMDQE